MRTLHFSNDGTSLEKQSICKVELRELKKQSVRKNIPLEASFERAHHEKAKNGTVLILVKKSRLIVCQKSDQQANEEE